MPDPHPLAFEEYLSPFSWRYGSPKMRAIWSEANKRRLWRRIWLALAEAQQTIGLVTSAQIAELRSHQDDIDILRAQEIEREIQHDLMAELHVYAEQCPLAAPIIHLGATSMDIEDNADALRMRSAMDLSLELLRSVILEFAGQIERWADAPTMAFTHLQPAEPTTVGYRLAQYSQDLWLDWQNLSQVRSALKGKGFKGAVGTSASYAQLLKDTSLSPEAFERRVMDTLSLEAVPVATQTYARKQEYLLLAALAGLGQSLYKFAFDFRLLQSPPFGEWSEPFAPRQVGSSAMPFKRNPINAENINSLARLLAALPRVAWDNAAHNLLERTLDDSANRREILPEAFLIVDELLQRTSRLIKNLHVDQNASARLLSTYGIFAASERLLMEAVKRGGDRQELHEVFRAHSMNAWDQIRAGDPNPLKELLSSDKLIRQYLNTDEVDRLLDVANYLGDAPIRAKRLARTLRDHLEASSAGG